MMERRRALMGIGAKPDPSIVYTLKNLDVPEFRTWYEPDAGFAPLAKDVSASIIMHIRIDELAAQSKLFAIWDTANNRHGAAMGRVTGRSNWMCVANSLGYSEIANAPYGTGEYKLCFTHAANSNRYNFRIKKISVGETVKSNTLTSNYVAVPSGVNFGSGTSGGASSFPKGKIYLAQFYSRVLSDDEINSFFA